MRYANGHCRMEIPADQNYRVLIGPCVICKKEQKVSVPKDGLERLKKGALMQVAFPTMTPGDQEFLISGFCEPCFDETFSEDGGE